MKKTSPLEVLTFVSVLLVIGQGCRAMQKTSPQSAIETQNSQVQSTDKSESCDKSYVRKQVLTKKRYFVNCIEQFYARGNDWGETHVLKINWKVDSKGRVDDSKVVGRKGGPDKLLEYCFLQGVRQLKFESLGGELCELQRSFYINSNPVVILSPQDAHVGKNNFCRGFHIKNKVESGQKGFQACIDDFYGREMQKNTEFKLLLSWMIGSSGAVERASAFDHERKSDWLLRDCFVDVIKKIQFERPRGGVCVVQYPFFLKGEDR